MRLKISWPSCGFVVPIWNVVSRHSEPKHIGFWIDTEREVEIAHVEIGTSVWKRNELLDFRVPFDAIIPVSMVDTGGRIDELHPQSIFLAFDDDTIPTPKVCARGNLVFIRVRV